MNGSTIPGSRVEDILQATIDGVPYTGKPKSRVEYLLLELKEAIEEGGGGGGGSQVETMPEADLDHLGKIVQYVGETTTNYTNGYFYKCVKEGNVYLWREWPTQPDVDTTIQVENMPTAGLSVKGKIVQYVGETTSDYTNGYFYKCVEDGGVYTWTQLDVEGDLPAGVISEAQWTYIQNKFARG